MKNLVAKFVSDQSGATSIEYVLIAGLISLAIIGGATTFGSAVNNKLSGHATRISNI